jgi:NAD(P)-dependent dehydrogenase (short-subunit alcohol dehydrogenase family)
MGIYPDLKEKRVVITGAAGGIGLVTAKKFLAEKSHVMIFDWNKEALEEMLHENPALVGGVHMDVSSPDEVEKAFAEVDNNLGGIDILIANAGISVKNPFLNITYEQWSKVIRVNLDGVFLCAQEAIKRMELQKTGKLVFMASVNGIEGHAYYADYNASKAGVILLAKTLAIEFAPWLHVNAICPGYVLTPMQEAEYTPEMMDKVNAEIPFKRHASTEEVANLFAFLASQDSNYITGQTFTIDGGETAGPILKK